MTGISILMPRGIRNNNPGNIRRNTVKWKGSYEPGADPDFVIFMAPEMGLRALMRLLLNYQRKFGLDSVESILNRFAPPHENATDHYITSVCNDMRVGRRAPLELQHKDTLIRLARAITRFENGRPGDAQDWYPDTVYDEAATLALKEENT